MTWIHALSFSLSLAFAFPAMGQPITPAPVITAGNAVLTVTAEGRSRRAPDIALFNAGVTSQGKTARDALSANSSAMERVVAHLQRAGVADRDIRTSNLNIEPVYSDPNREAAIAARMSGQPYVQPAEPSAPRIIGYRASNSVSIRQRDLESFGRVIDALVAAGANLVNGPSFTLHNSDTALDEARIEAMAKARERAQLYAKAAGLRVLRILSINEGGGSYGPSPVIMVTGQAMGGAPPPPPPAPIQPGELQMAVSLTVLFELGP